MAVATQELAEMVGAGKRLMCWCAGAPMNKTCHGVIIAQIARLLAFKCE
jgi:hypothetical protein